jgi:hypothetical protein
MADTPIVAATWSPPQQQDPPGWVWESAGVSVRRDPVPTYQGRQSPCAMAYFGGPHYPASSDQYHGQEGDR